MSSPGRPGWPPGELRAPAQLAQRDAGGVADGAAGPGAQRGQLGGQGRHGMPGEAGPQVLGPGQDQGPGLVDRRGAFPGGTALGDHEGTDGLNGTVAALGRAAGPAGPGGPGSADGIEGVRFALPAAVLPAGPVSLHDPDTGRGDVPGQARTVTSGALDPDQAHGPEPAQQPGITRRRGRELPHAR